MRAGRKDSVRRHVTSQHDVISQIVSFIDYLTGRASGHYPPSAPPTYQGKNIDEQLSIYRICDIREVNYSMGYGTCCGTGFQKARSFLTKEERIGLLKVYKDDLEKERKGMVERIKELEAS